PSHSPAIGSNVSIFVGTFAFAGWDFQIAPPPLNNRTRTTAVVPIFNLFHAIIVNAPFTRLMIDDSTAPDCASAEAVALATNAAGAAVALGAESAPSKPAAETTIPHPPRTERNFSSARPTRIFAAA